jgi:hypothetical protein
MATHESIIGDQRYIHPVANLYASRAAHDLLDVCLATILLMPVR